jgi:hypothetical protein
MDLALALIYTIGFTLYGIERGVHYDKINPAPLTKAEFKKAPWEAGL